MTFILRAKRKMNEKKFMDYLKRYGWSLNSLQEYCYNNRVFSPAGFVVNFGSLSEEQFAQAARVMCDALRKRNV